MAALSDYLESGLLNFIFRGQSFSAPSNISIALTSGAPLDSHTGSTIPELASGVDPGNSTGYSRVILALRPQLHGLTKLRSRSGKWSCEK